MVQYSVNIGKITNFGMFGFDARNMSYDPALALSTANQDGLLLFAELDSLVTPSINLEQLQAIFEGETPPRISTYTLRGANHAFQIVPDICSQRTPNLSPEYFEIIGSWLATYVNASPKNTTASAVAISTH